MDIRRLEVFCKVVEMKSFTKAAEAVYLSQPSVSEHVRLLEDTLGEKLLDRLGRKVLPTQAGQILYQYARRIIRLRDEAIQTIEEYRGNLSGTLAIGASTIPGAYILPALLEAFKDQNPSIQLVLKIFGTSKVVKDLLEGELELGVIGAKWKDHRLECREFLSDELVVVTSPDHPWAQRKDVSLQELESQPFILRERGSGTRMVMTQALKEHGIDPAQFRTVAEMGSTEAVRQGIKAHIGISIVSSLAVEEDIRRGSLVSVPLKGLRIPRSFYLVYRKSRQMTPLAVAFLNHIQRHGAKGLNNS